ncbi:hypothetical protein ONZ45_g7936 [Pleurotus djamor]|nr:hypothetical protein ONZ45_g7936 [Pleurotus djamor]
MSDGASLAEVIAELETVNAKLDGLLARDKDLETLIEQMQRQHLLDFSHGVPKDTNVNNGTTAVQAIAEILSILPEHDARLQFLSWEGLEPSHIIPLIPLLNKSTTFTALRTLHLALYVPDKSSHPTRHRDWTNLPNWSSPLRDLRLENLKPFSLSPCLYANLRRLEIAYTPPLSSRRGRTDFASLMPIQDFCDLLLAAKHLEALVVSHVKLSFPPRQTTSPTNNADSVIPPVQLPKLKHLEYNGHLSYLDLSRLLARLSCPMLQVLEVGLDTLDDHSGNAYGTLQLPALKEFFIETSCDPPFRSSCPTFSFASLEHLEITNTRLRPGSSDFCPELLVLPRLEYIFRHPRLAHLTHLTLSRFKMTQEEDADGRLILCYLPALSSLSLDNCAGVGMILGCLQELSVVTFTRGGQRSNDKKMKTLAADSRTKFCPTLEALDIWGCDDMVFDDLRAVVAIRNGFGTVQNSGPDSNASSSQDHQKLGKAVGWVKPTAPAHGTTPTGGSDHGHVAMKAPKNAEEGGSKSRDGQAPRIIRPLRIGKHHPKKPVEPVHGQGVLVSTPIVPAMIDHVRIEGCKLVTEDQAYSLRDVGVLDVLWKA